MANYFPKESLRVLLAEIVDYAGLFPPAQLSMKEAVINFAHYKNSDYKWMLGRFIVPVARLEEFLESARGFVSEDAEDVWHLSVLASEDIYETVAKVQDFNEKNAPSIVCDAVEVKANTSSLIREISNATLPNLATYVELPLDENLADLVSTLAISDLRGKIRTGGVTPEAFPTAREIIRFVRACLAANVPFKATAGLHHPLRCRKPLTYEPNAETGAMNGFLNLFLAAGFARGNLSASVLEELMHDGLADNFEFAENGVMWRREHFLSVEQLSLLRRRNIISFGSCSFVEPIEDLREIELL